MSINLVNLLGITYQSNEITSVTADSLENHFTSHGLSDKSHEEWVQTECPRSANICKQNPLGKSKAM
jgi:hypothetical protein